MLHTPDGPVRLTFVAQLDAGAMWSAFVDRQVHVARQRVLAANRVRLHHQ